MDWKHLFIMLCSGQSISCFLMFIAVKIKVCRKSLKNTFMLIPDMFSFNLNTRLESYCQIFFQNFRLLESPNQGKDLSNCNGTRTQNHLNGWVFVYEVSGYGFESRCSHLNFRYRVYFEQGVPWHSGNCRLWIHSKIGTWYDKNIRSSKEPALKVFKLSKWFRYIFFLDRNRSRNYCKSKFIFQIINHNKRLCWIGVLGYHFSISTSSLTATPVISF